MFVEREDRWRDMSYEEVMDRMAQKGKKGHRQKVVSQTD